MIIIYGLIGIIGLIVCLLILNTIGWVVGEVVDMNSNFAGFFGMTGGIDMGWGIGIRICVGLLVVTLLGIGILIGLSLFGVIPW